MTETTELCLYADVGTRGRKRMPHSEVCLHMRIAGKYMDFAVVGDQYPMVQLYLIPGPKDRFRRFSRPFSSCITTGEAGLFRNSDRRPEENRYYYYPHEFKDTNLDSAAELQERPCDSQKALWPS